MVYTRCGDTSESPEGWQVLPYNGYNNKLKVRCMDQSATDYLTKLNIIQT